MVHYASSSGYQVLLLRGWLAAGLLEHRLRTVLDAFQQRVSRGVTVAFWGHGDRLAHVHMADGTGSRNDEHLVPGRGTQACADVLERLARTGYGGVVVLEINTRRAASHDERVADLAESLAFTRDALSAARA